MSRETTTDDSDLPAAALPAWRAYRAMLDTKAAHFAALESSEQDALAGVKPRLALQARIAALLDDLKARGLWDDTLVVWTTEFGRTPFNTAKDAKGREHHAEAFSSWLAGGGVRGGFRYGETDEHGCAVVGNEVHVHDFHATILHLLGLDHERLTYRHAGRDFRLTDVAGRVIEEVLA